MVITDEDIKLASLIFVGAIIVAITMRLTGFLFKPKTKQTKLILLSLLFPCFVASVGFGIAEWHLSLYPEKRDLNFNLLPLQMAIALTFSSIASVAVTIGWIIAVSGEAS